MRFGVLGPVEVHADDGRPVRVPELKVRILLADLLVHRGEPVPADRLIHDLWGERPPANPKGALQARVSQLRRAFEDAEPGGRELVASRPPGYALRVTTLDADRFVETLRRAEGADEPAVRVALLDEALGLWRGPAYADVADALFAQPAVARLEELRLTAVEARAEARLDPGELAELVARHPLRERLRAAYMRALYLAGRPDEALDTFRDLRLRLREELGADPGPEVVDLHRAVLTHDPGLRPPTHPALPVPLTGLVGRDADVDRVARLLTTERLVTLVGIGGVGKTRVALAVAHATPGPAWFTELDGLAPTGRDAGTGVLAEVATVLCRTFGVRADTSPGVRARPSDPPARLVEAVRQQRGLLVLDNCEHVAGAAAELAARLLAAAPGLRVLATSREPLELPGETLHPVDPLPVDAAVALFAARAAAADPGFALDAATEPDVVAICRRLDGIPLALELAAARVRALGLRTLAQRLGDGFAVLTSGRRSAPIRQQTLLATLDWSWDLLTDAERAVLRRLSVFAGSFDVDAAERVCSGDRVLITLAQLVDRSLVVRVAGRYRMLESVTAYAARRLAEAGESGWARDLHLAYYLALAERAAPLLHGRDQHAWLERLDAEGGNLRVALDHAVTSGNGAAALRLVDALAWYWFLRGHPGAGIRAADAALAVPGNGGPRAAVRAWRAGLGLWTGESKTELPAVDDPGVSARAQCFVAFAGWSGRDPAAARRVEAALRASRAVGDTWGVAAALATSAWYALVRDDLPAARRDSTEAEELFARLGDQWGRMQAMDVLAAVAEVTGDYTEAARHHSDGLRIAEALGSVPEVSGRLTGLGRIALLTGDLDAADAYHERARRLAAEQANADLLDYAELGLALAARRRGDLDTVERLFARWADPDTATGFAALTPLAELGFAAELRGDGERALALHQAGYREARACGGPRALALALEGIAGALSLLGDHRQAARLLGTADATRRRAGAPLPPAERHDVDRITARCRAALDRDEFATAFAEGADLPPDRAVSDMPDGHARAPLA